MAQPLAEDNAVRRLHAEYATVRALARSASLAEAAPRVLEAVCESLGWSFGALWRPDRGSDRLRCRDAWASPSGPGKVLAERARKATVRKGEGLPGRAWKSGETVWTPDVGEEPGSPREELAASEGLLAGLAVPVPFRDRFVGVLEFFNETIPLPDIGLLEMLDTIASQVGQFAEHKRTEEELATLFENSREMLCIASFDGYLLRVNPAWERTLGYTAEELTSRPYMEFVHPDDREATVAEEESVSGGKLALLFENRYRCRDGSYRWLSWNSMPVVEQGLIYCSVRDVTEQRRVAVELREARDAARAETPGEGAGPVVDETRLLERVFGDREALAELIEVFLADARVLLARIDRALGKGDRPAVRAAAHTLKGAVSNFAASEATRAAARLQQATEGETLEGARAARDALAQELERVREALSNLS